MKEVARCCSAAVLQCWTWHCSTRGTTHCTQHAGERDPILSSTYCHIYWKIETSLPPINEGIYSDMYPNFGWRDPSSNIMNIDMHRCQYWAWRTLLLPSDCSTPAWVQGRATSCVRLVRPLTTYPRQPGYVHSIHDYNPKVDEVCRVWCFFSCNPRK